MMQFFYNIIRISKINRIFLTKYELLNAKIFLKKFLFLGNSYNNNLNMIENRKDSKQKKNDCKQKKKIIILNDAHV